MSFTEITSESWFSRIGSSIKGIIVGIVLIPIAIIVLFWNEGRAVKRSEDLDDGASKIVKIDAASVVAANEGKLVHVTGQTATEETLTDPTYKVTQKNVVKLQRLVEFYQFKENVETTSKKKLGGSKETKKTYTYSKAWVGSPIDSSQFKDTAYQSKNTVSHQVSDQSFSSKAVSLGAFALSAKQIGSISATTPLTLNGSELDPVPSTEADPTDTAKKAPYQISGNYFYHGAKPNAPSIGDVRISFKTAPVGDTSIIAQQNNNSFVAYQSTNDALDMLKSGIHSSEAMFAQAEDANSNLSWFLRAGGAIAMAIGFGMILKPLSVVMDVIPFLGSIAGTGTGLIAILLSVIISSGVIAVAWLFHRPLLSGVLLLVIIGAIFLIRKKMTAKA